MPIALPPETRSGLIESIKLYFLNERDEEIGDLAAGFLLDFVLETIAPSIYNQAIRDAQASLLSIVEVFDENLLVEEEV